jgi:hypothetical protein
MVSATSNISTYLAGKVPASSQANLLEKIEGLANPTAVAFVSSDAIYVGEVNGTNVGKFVKK